MKKAICIVAVMALFAFAGNVQAQNCNAPKAQNCKFTPEQRIDQKVARMQKRLMLDDATAQKFAPIYKEYLAALAECCPKQGKACQKGACNLTDEQIKENIENCISAEAKRADVKDKYYKKLSKVLNARQLQVVFCKKNAKCGKNKMQGQRWNKGRKGAKGGAHHGWKGKRGAGKKAANCPVQKQAEKK